MSCPSFIAQSMALRTATHLAHLSTKSYAHHMALGDFYDDLLDLVDKYAEIYMGLEGQVTKWPSAELPTGSPVEMLEEYLGVLAEEEAEDHDSQALIGVLAELEELTARTIYKLRFLK